MQFPTDKNLTNSNTQVRNRKFYYGWIVLVACLAFLITSSGIRHSFGVFFKPLEADFDLSRALTSEIFTVYLALSALFAILAGWIIDRYEPKILFTVMGFFTGLSLLLTSQATELWHIFISYSLLLAIGTGAVYIQAISITLKWFMKGRGLAVGIVASGMGIGIILMTPISAWLIDSYGWQTSFFILALVAFFVMIPFALLLKRAPDKKAELLHSEETDTSKLSVLNKIRYDKVEDYTLLQAVRTSFFWLITFVRFLLGCCVYMVLTHIVPHAIDLGINPIQAASILSLAGGGTIMGMLLMGRASDIIGRKQILLICALLLTASMLWVVWSSSIWMLYIFAVIFGFSMGGTSPTVNSLIVDVFGTRHIGVINAVSDAGWGIGSALGPLLAGYVFDISGSYYYAFLAGMAAALITVILTLFARAPEAKTRR
ncbi:MFS transporter [Chloroflexota bacterium]